MMIEPGYEPGPPLSVCPTCKMKAPVRDRGCVVCDLLGYKPKPSKAGDVERVRKQRKSRGDDW